LIRRRACPGISRHPPILHIPPEGDDIAQPVVFQGFNGISAAYTFHSFHADDVRPGRTTRSGQCRRANVDVRT